MPEKQLHQLIFMQHFECVDINKHIKQYYFNIILFNNIYNFFKNNVSVNQQQLVDAKSFIKYLLEANRQCYFD